MTKAKQHHGDGSRAHWKTRVYWSSDETHKVARAALDREYNPSGDDIIRQIRELQKIVLDEKRWRKITTMTNISSTNPNKPGVIEVMKALADGGYKPRHVKVELEPLEIVGAVQTEELATSAAPEPETETHLPEGLELHALPVGYALDLLAETLARQLVDRFMTYLRQDLAEAVSKDFLPAIGPAVKASKILRPRILVVGLKPQQAGMVINEFGNMLDLRFVDSSHQTNAVQGKIGNVDKVIGMVNFMNHSTEHYLKKHEGYMRVSGGMDSLRDELRKLAPRQQTE